MSQNKSPIQKIKNNIIISRSKVSQNTPEDVEELARAKEAGTTRAYYNFLGKHPATVEKDAEVRKVTNGRDTYYTADSISSVEWKRFFSDPRVIEPTTVHSTMRRFSVFHNNTSASITIAHNQVKIEGDVEVPPYEITFDNSTISDPVEKFDINNINSIRYALRGNEQASFFLDKYFIVTPEERKSYAEYKKTRDAQKAMLTKGKCR